MKSWSTPVPVNHASTGAPASRPPPPTASSAGVRKGGREPAVREVWVVGCHSQGVFKSSYLSSNVCLFEISYQTSNVCLQLVT